MFKLLAYSFPLWLVGYSIYSFSQTDPNLVLSGSSKFWDFQQTMWQFGLNQRFWSSLLFLGLCLGLFASYLSLINQLRRNLISVKQSIVLFLISITCLLPAYPALSHDVFNYIFNAKMAVVYRADPHIRTALDYAADPWLRFMHNVHTPAPYGYGWTGLSLIPYLLGGEKIQVQMLVFRGVAITSLIMCLWLITKIEKVSPKQLALFAFNPLILIEIVGNMHNDLVMMALALAGGVLMRNGYKKRNYFLLISGIGIFGLSISIKYVTIALVGAFLASLAWKRLSRSQWAVLSLWSPLFITRSQRFLPWYLSWSLAFLPLVESKRWQRFMVATSFAGLTSYWLILYYGDYSSSLLLWRSVWLFGIPILSGINLIRKKDETT